MSENEMDNKSKMIFLYRHGETNWNVEDRITGQLKNANIYFTKHGYEQIEEISNSLQENRIEAIFSSDLERAVDTANLANKFLHLPVFYSEKIRGLNMGKYQGLKKDEFINQENVCKCFANHSLAIDGGESINALNERMINFLIEVCKETRYKRIAVITHSAAISNLKAYLSNNNYVRTNRCVLLYKNNVLSVLEYGINNIKC